MKVSMRATYGIMVAVDLATYAKEAPIQARAIARRHGIPVRFLEQILHAMKKAGLVESQRGAQGGYLLTHEPAAMSIADIFEALEGPVFHRSFVGQQTRNRQATKPELLLGDVWEQVQQAERKVLENVTVEHLAMRLRTIDAQRSPMYHI
ncbi:MAG: RrF2 family transcriptional regulator [Nitrospira sp.]|jgi:Rrf2 family transcriptional regulator, cysteine metabolism repressor